MASLVDTSITSINTEALSAMLRQAAEAEGQTCETCKHEDGGGRVNYCDWLERPVPNGFQRFPLRGLDTEGHVDAAIA